MPSNFVSNRIPERFGTFCRKLEKPITFRRSEYNKRPETVKSLQSSISVARRFVESIRANTMEEDRYHTDEELDKLELVCDDAEDWLAAKQREQDKLALYVDPVLLTTDIESQAKVVERETMTLLMKKKPKKEKKKEKEEEGKTEEGKEEETKAQEGKTAETKTQEGEEPETPVVTVKRQYSRAWHMRKCRIKLSFVERSSPARGSASASRIDTPGIVAQTS
ncbi:hypothetical protein BC938DRAFT_473439 [Jimgerdemannia flammicorona]|uniref:Hsp70 protein-domain-containing protein n=1 Tax=Jimgerdemannia flammicorona TaxID=994334 RepID=A0A433Q418_9FUNG|nr:hypothetical protein BC938DRAFT_473439 [Jimgerdemannia flammicorona]